MSKIKEDILKLKTNEELYEYLKSFWEILEECQNIDFGGELRKHKNAYEIKNIRMILEISIK